MIPPTTKKKYERKRAIFKFLHNPNTKWSHAYHSVVCTFLCTHAIMQNFYLDFDQYRDYFMWKHQNQTWSQLVNSGLVKPTSERSLDSFTLAVDSSLAVFLVVEIAVRLWSSTYIATYACGIKGCFAYLKAYRYRRFLDLMGILFYVLSIVSRMWKFQFIDDKWSSAIRIIQTMQIWQANRILFPYMRVIFHTIFGFQSHYLLFCMFLIFMMISLSSAIIYLSETNNKQTEIFSIFRSFWFTFETFSTIGYGDIVPKFWFSKFLICLLSVLGIFVFSLPSNIIGTTLSIKMNKDPQKSLKYRKAVRLIQTVWRCRISDLNNPRAKHYSAILCRALEKSQKESVGNRALFSKYPVKQPNLPMWSKIDQMCINFFMKTNYFIARYRLLQRQNINLSYTDLSQQNAEMWHRLEYIEKDLSLLSTAVYEQLHSHLGLVRNAVERVKWEIAEMSTAQ
ncbi:Potassium voltage-gated channel sub KQT member 4 [Tyrophagus putrescentiae]|nr:Potassium voltage-gated channel sub KQT member 4 [Tyrophagus putrescentiae]